MTHPKMTEARRKRVIPKGGCTLCASPIYTAQEHEALRRAGLARFQKDPVAIWERKRRHGYATP